MGTYRELLRVVEKTLASTSARDPISGQKRADFIHVLQHYKNDFRSLLERPGPKAEDREQVLKKEVQLPDSPPTSLDDQDLQIVLKLSDDYDLNEVECVKLLVATHQECGIAERAPLEIVRLAAGLWLTERRSLLTALQLLLRLVVLEDSAGDAPLLAAAYSFVEEVVAGGLRGRLLTLLKELGRDDALGRGRQQAEPLVMDARGALVQRRQVAQRERLLLAHCLLYTCLVSRIDPSEAREIWAILQECAREWTATQEGVDLQLAYTLMFALVVSLVSDSLAGEDGPAPRLASDAAFRKEFQEQLMAMPLTGSTPGLLLFVRFSWAVFLANSGYTSGAAPPGAPAGDIRSIRDALDGQCLAQALSFMSKKVLQSAAFQNDNPDLTFTCLAYLHRLLCCFLTHPVGRDTIQSLKEAAGRAAESQQAAQVQLGAPDQLAEGAQAEAFVALMEVVGQVYSQEPELMQDNAALWAFVAFCGEDHRGPETMAAFLNLLTALASGEDATRQVYGLLQGPPFQGLSWATLFSTLQVYEERLRSAPRQAGGSTMPQGDVLVLQAYLACLAKVASNTPSEELGALFPSLEPLFCLLPYSAVPPSLKGELRSAITAFVVAGGAMRDSIWKLLEHYDMPVAAQPARGGTGAASPWQKGYDLTRELTEVEARLEHYPSTLSYLTLLNALLAVEPGAQDQGRRYLGLFHFVRDHVLAGQAQRAFQDPVQKWRLAGAALEHLVALLAMLPSLDLGAEGPLLAQPAPGVPGEEIMQDLMGGKVVYRSVMGILTLGPEVVLEERARQAHGGALEDAVRACFRLLLLALERDRQLARRGQGQGQTLDVLLGYDACQLGVLLEFVRYDALPEIQRAAIRLLAILSGRMPQLVALLLEAGCAERLAEDYAACLEARIQEAHPSALPEQDCGVLILQLLVEGMQGAAPTVTHLLLRFDTEHIERSVLDPRRTYSCLRVLLDFLVGRDEVESNALIHELGLELLSKLSADPLTTVPIVHVLRSPKYSFLDALLERAACEPLPRRGVKQHIRTSSLQQRAWLLKLLAVALHTADTDVLQQRVMCQLLLADLFQQSTLPSNLGEVAGLPSSRAPKLVELLSLLQFKLPEVRPEWAPHAEAILRDLQVAELLGEGWGLYRPSVRGNLLLDLTLLEDALVQEWRRVDAQQQLAGAPGAEAAAQAAIQEVLRWAERRNQVAEERAAQLHLATAWAHLLQVAVARRFYLWPAADKAGALLELLGLVLDAINSPDCSLQMALPLAQAVGTLLGRLQEGAVAPGEGAGEDVGYADLLASARPPSAACLALLPRLLAGLLRADSSEALRRRLYSALLAFLHYAQEGAAHQVPPAVLRTLAGDGPAAEEAGVAQVHAAQAELARGIFEAVRREAGPLVDVLARDAAHGAEVSRSLAFSVLAQLLAAARAHQPALLLSQLQSRGLLQACLADVSHCPGEALLMPSAESLRQLYTLEAQLGLLVQLGALDGGRGAQALLAMGAPRKLGEARVLHLPLPEGPEGPGTGGQLMPSARERHHQLLGPVLRLLLCMAAQGGEAEREVGSVVRLHEALFARILMDASPSARFADLEDLRLACALLEKVWPAQVGAERAHLQELLFAAIGTYLGPRGRARPKYLRQVEEVECAADAPAAAREGARQLELGVARVRCSLAGYLHELVLRQGVRLRLLRPQGLALGQQPSLQQVAEELCASSAELEAGAGERTSLLTKLRDVNEMSRLQVEDAIRSYAAAAPPPACDSLRKRRHVAMLEMLRVLTWRDKHMTALLQTVERMLEMLHAHLEGSQAQDTALERKAMEAVAATALPALERLQALDEERAGRSLQHVGRLLKLLRANLFLDSSTALFSPFQAAHPVEIF